MSDDDRITTDEDVEDAARRFIIRYGEKAAEEATHRAVELSDAQDPIGVETWERIKETILRMTTSDESHKAH